ncbi:Di-glucose binding within endoplasmic reticulum [Halogranum amylolyticum]|uniref:Di-glucose binding within endoplasmic reticulum n=1 Tax=Halogranum amylolyticum TaxID=660520 RepID=A0A1H8UQP7_9EURY|nr:malectin domain-containing carbohydrate-binding protein [Halogranum amylolyticum]SEP04898.1 Di-glucose binding within endoplasmic reticulum [Halogranum amylolyticum]
MFEWVRSSSNSQRAQGRIQWVLLGVGGLFFLAGVLLVVGVPAAPFGGLAADGEPASTPEAETTQTAEPTPENGGESTPTSTQQSPTESTATAESTTSTSTQQSPTESTATAESTTSTSTPASGAANQTNNTTNTSAQIVHRVNVGGQNVSANDSGPAWAADTDNNPSPYLNSRASDTVVQSTPDNITTEGNVPPGVSDAVFKTYRFDRGSNGQAEEMVWRFPVEQNRDYEVRLYFLEAYFTAKDSGRAYEEPYSEGGPRTFGVAINGEQVLSNYEPFVEHGHDVGAMKSFEVTAENGMVEIRFLREAENPTVSGIEIVETGPRDR